MSRWGLILAAGASSRMGRDKALLPWGRTTLLEAGIAALQPHCRGVVVVAGRNAASLEPVAAGAGAELVINPDPDRGQISSLQVGLQVLLDRGVKAAMITPVDCPPLSPASLQALGTEFERAMAEGIWAVIPEHAGRRGHPLLAGGDLMAALLAAPQESNAREVLALHAQRLRCVEVSEPYLGRDLNTPRDLQLWSGI